MDADITIIGAGVIGLAIAAECADERLNIYLLEKNGSHGRGISSRNSEVIHAGLYYPSGSLKGRLCIEGRTMLYELCTRYALPHKKTGKLLIAATEHEMPKVEQLWSNARQNGVTSVSLLDQRQIMRLEPNIRAFGALYSPETGILNVHALMDYYLHAAKGKGVEIACRTEVKGIEPISGGYRVMTMNGAGEYFEFSTERVINAAGLHSDTIARMVGKDYTLHYCKGNYFSITTGLKGMVQRLVYPVPEEHHVGLGVHLTLDLTGRMKLGPDATYIGRYEDYRVDKERADLFYASAVKFLPFIKREEIVPDMAGIRPKLQGEGEPFRDFIISEDLPGFINLVGIESPGLTAAPAIARYVKNLLT
ncbi:MAG: NAD(P)/FAD-dependent oxidoreductase [Nitrospirota bacterium]